MQKFDEFYASVVSDAKDLTNAPALPRYRKAPSRPGKDGDPAHRFEGPLEYFRQQYFEAIDVLVGQLKDRFEQRKGLPMAAKMEQILLEAANGDCCTVERLEEELQIYEKDLSMVQLHLQLQMLPNLVNTRNSLRKDQPPITKITKVRTIAELLTEVEVGKSMLPEVSTLLQIYFTLPVTTATAERSFSALRRLKTFLRSTMTQPRLNSAMLLHVHKERCAKLDILELSKLFASANDRRKHFFGRFC